MNEGVKGAFLGLQALSLLSCGFYLLEPRSPGQHSEGRTEIVTLLKTLLKPARLENQIETQGRQPGVLLLA